MLDWFKENIKLVIFVLMGVIVFSVLLGILIGLINRNYSTRRYREEKYAEKMYKELEEAKKLQEESKNNINLTPDFLIPDQLDIRIRENIDLLNNVYYDFVKRMKLKDIRISELLSKVSPDIDCTIKAVIYNNKEPGIITFKDDLYEP